MKALTVWQPWATLIAIGAKPYEFRGWAAPKAVRGQRIAIHAGARPVKRDEVQDLLVRLRRGDGWTTGLHVEPALELLDRVLTSPGVLARSAVVCTAVLGEPVRAHEIAHVFGGSVNDSDLDEHMNFAWPMLDVRTVVPAVEVRGAQGLWNWNDAPGAKEAA